MRSFVSIFLILAGVSVHASESCPGYSEEKAVFWQTRRPANPGPLRLARAWVTYRSEQQKLTSIRYDKWAHCYGGCRIAQDVDAETAFYVAWLKEDRDLRDCKAGTRFDPSDEAATNLGAGLAEEAGSPEDCLSLCKGALPR